MNANNRALPYNVAEVVILVHRHMLIYCTVSVIVRVMRLNLRSTQGQKALEASLGKADGDRKSPHSKKNFKEWVLTKKPLDHETRTNHQVH